MFRTAFNGGVWLGVGIVSAAYLVLAGLIGVIRSFADPEYKGIVGLDIFFGLLGIAFLVWDILVYRKSVKLMDEAQEDIDFIMAYDYGVFDELEKQEKAAK